MTNLWNYVSSSEEAVSSGREFQRVAGCGPEQSSLITSHFYPELHIWMQLYQSRYYSCILLLLLLLGYDLLQITVIINMKTSLKMIVDISRVKLSKSNYTLERWRSVKTLLSHTCAVSLASSIRLERYVFYLFRFHSHPLVVILFKIKPQNI